MVPQLTTVGSPNPQEREPGFDEDCSGNLKAYLGGDRRQGVRQKSPKQDTSIPGPERSARDYIFPLAQTKDLSPKETGRQRPGGQADEKADGRQAGTEEGSPGESQEEPWEYLDKFR